MKTTNPNTKNTCENTTKNIKIEYIDGVKCGLCPNCNNYTIDGYYDDMRDGSNHCVDCGWLDEIGHRCDIDGNIINEECQCVCEQCKEI